MTAFQRQLTHPEQWLAGRGCKIYYSRTTSSTLLKTLEDAQEFVRYLLTLCYQYDVRVSKSGTTVRWWL